MSGVPASKARKVDKVAVCRVSQVCGKVRFRLTDMRVAIDASCGFLEPFVDVLAAGVGVCDTGDRHMIVYRACAAASGSNSDASVVVGSFMRAGNCVKRVETMRMG
jgi:hypothetical protein